MEVTMLISSVERVGKVDPQLYSSFTEYMGRAAYEGIYQLDHPSADESGFRQDVIHSVKELNIPMTRYPGGNLVSGFRWEDSIGPIAGRPRRLDLTWRTIETNEVGIHEFYNWCQHVGAEISMAVNLGTRGVDATRDLVEYCNFPKGTYWSNLRCPSGQESPFGIKTWCLGDEMDGPQQIGHKAAEEYGRLAAEMAKAMKPVDDSIEVVLRGSSNRQMPTLGDWELAVLDQVYDQIDYLSFHQYYGDQENDLSHYLARSLDTDRFTSEVTAMCDTIKTKKHSKKQVNLSFDEWNIWYHSAEQDEQAAPQQIAPPLLEDNYNFEDALLLGCLLITLLKHADRIKIARLAQSVNVIAPIRTETNGEAWRQTIYYPFMQAVMYGQGEVLSPQIHSTNYATGDFKEVPYLESVAVINSKELVIFAVNRGEEEVDLTVRLSELSIVGVIDFPEMSGFDTKATNLPKSEQVEPSHSTNVKAEDGKINCLLKPLSWNVVRCYLSDEGGTKSER